MRPLGLWDYRGISSVTRSARMGHKYAGIVEEAGREITSIKPGQSVTGSFFASDNTRRICQAGYQSARVHREYVGQTSAIH